MEETGKKSTEESESLYVGSSALSSGTSYLIVTSLSSSIIVYLRVTIICRYIFLRILDSVHFTGIKFCGC